MTQELIDKFKEKQGFENAKQVDERTWAFDGFHFDISDIRFDMVNGVTPGRIKLYHHEGLNGGKIPSYNVWLASWEAL